MTTDRNELFTLAQLGTEQPAVAKAEVLKVIRAARKEFAAQGWGSDDDAAVDAFIRILRKRVCLTLTTT
jgi:hypothetical protein